MRAEIVPLLTDSQEKNVVPRIIEELKSLTLFSVDIALIEEASFKETSINFDWMTGDVTYMLINVIGKGGEKLFLEADIPEIESLDSVQDLERYRAMILLHIYLKLASGEEDDIFLRQMVISLQKIERMLISKTSICTSMSDQITTD